MKKLVLSAVVAVATLTAGAAMAQPYRGYDRYDRYDGYYGRDRYERDWRYRDSDRDGIPDRREWNRDRDRDGRPDQYDRYDNRYGNRSDDRYEGRRGHGHAYGHDSYRGQGRWRQGQVYSYYRQPNYVISDYRSYRLPPPRPGYRYYRSDNGDVLMVAIASGLIGAVLAGALNDNDHNGRYDRYDSYGRRY